MPFRAYGVPGEHVFVDDLKADPGFYGLTLIEASAPIETITCEAPGWVMSWPGNDNPGSGPLDCWERGVFGRHRQAALVASWLHGAQIADDQTTRRLNDGDDTRPAFNTLLR